VQVTTLLRGITEEELESYIRAVEAGFGHHGTDDAVAGWASLTEVPRALAVFDGDEMVATAGAFSLDVTVPGGEQLPAAGVTAVTVRSTHRRRGLLRQMMNQLFDHARDREEPLAVLTASESHIYGRFGYGIASFGESFSVATDRSAFRRHPEVGGRFRLVDEKTVRSTFPAVHDIVRRRTPGDINRTDPWWDLAAADAEFMREGKKPAFRVLHEDAAGNPDGYAVYRYENKWAEGNPAKKVEVEEVIAADPNVELALWRYLFDLDLVSEVRGSVPQDSPLRWALLEPRRFVVKQVWEGIWVRILDVDAALPARRYPLPGSLVLQVGDEGTFRLDVADTGEATCAAVTSEPDLVLGLEELGSMYLGAVRASTLAAAGRVSGTAKSIRVADAIFASERAPYLSTGF
jgi:predicted acetyltransferase